MEQPAGRRLPPDWVPEGFSCKPLAEEKGSIRPAIGTMDVNRQRVAAGVPRAERFIASFFPPDFVSKSSDIWEGIFESLWMTVVSTVIGILLSIPVGLGAARNLAPRPIYLFFRGVLAVSRTFPEIIIGFSLLCSSWREE